MSEYILSCESTADLSAQKLASLDVEYVCFHFSLGATQYRDDLGKSVPFEDFYRRMAAGEETKTAAIGTGDYVEYFRPFLEQGKDILHVALSSGLSSSYDSACGAAALLKDEFPDRSIYVVDSLGASSGYGLIMQTLSERRAAGEDISSLHAWIEENKLRLHHWFFSTDLTFYIKGGRVSPVAGFIGNALNICPLLNMDRKGHLIPREKIHSKKKVIKRIVEKMTEDAEGGLSYDGKVFLSHSDCMQDAEAVVALVKEQFPNMDGQPLINDIGTTIGSHTGPGTVALFFWGREREQ